MQALIFEKKARTGWCGLLVGFALALRLALAPGTLPRLWAAAAELAGRPQVARAVVYLQTGAVPPDTAPAVTTPAAETAAATETPPVTETVPATETAAATETVPATETAAETETVSVAETVPAFTPEEGEALELGGNCDYTVDKGALLAAPTALAGRTVLIVHTHACEAYSPEDYESAGDHRTLDTAQNVVAVGDALTVALEELGLRVIHDTTLCDAPSYNSSYAVARQRIKTWLEQEPEIGLVLDLHRDALATPVRETGVWDGADCARLMLVVGTDEGGLEHPGWEANLSCALKLQALLARQGGGLVKPLNLRRERFNGDLSPGAMIIEVGSTENTLQEARTAMVPLARAIRALLDETGLGIEN